MKKNGVILHGSARSNGNTRMIADLVAQQSGFELVDLVKLKIGAFDYDFKNSEDDYLPLMRRVSEEFDSLVFATPVYWYSMSGLMKDFFDRFTDLLRVEKEIGRKLSGKTMSLISCSSGPERPDYFAGPFEATAGYLGMHYAGDLHGWIEGEVIPETVAQAAREFAARIKKCTPLG